MRGAWDMNQRDKELDADGVTAEVMFADADAITGMASPLSEPASRRAPSPTPSSPSPAHGPTTASWPRCAAAAPSVTVDRGADHPSIERSVAEIEWLAEQPGLRGIMVPTMWRDLPPYDHPD